MVVIHCTRYLAGCLKWCCESRPCRQFRGKWSRSVAPVKSLKFLACALQQKLTLSWLCMAKAAIGVAHAVFKSSWISATILISLWISFESFKSHWILYFTEKSTWKLRYFILNLIAIFFEIIIWHPTSHVHRYFITLIFEPCLPKCVSCFLLSMQCVLSLLKSGPRVSANAYVWQFRQCGQVLGLKRLWKVLEFCLAFFV